MDLDPEDYERLGYARAESSVFEPWRADEVPHMRSASFATIDFNGWQREQNAAASERRAAERAAAGIVRVDGRWRFAADVDRERRSAQDAAIRLATARDRNTGCCRCCGEPAFTIVHGWCRGCIAEPAQTRLTWHQ